MIQVLCQYACLYTPRWHYNQEEGAIKANANSKIHKRDDYPPIAGRLCDESRFVLWTDDNRVRVWRRPGERYNSPLTVLRHTARTAGAMVLGAIAYDSRSTLIVIRGTLTGQRYVDDILQPHVGPFLIGLPGAIFQQDNARPHTARVSQDFLRHFQTLPWPTCSPICPL
ncbi:transposable element Tcb1 transposase [Trichonephila clavipes]|nr:transposable element Tcb1 transposase [Trichonephila clavipes]